MKYIEFDSSKKYDLILLGRIAVDLNPVDYYCPLNESTTFENLVFEQFFHLEPSCKSKSERNDLHPCNHFTVFFFFFLNKVLDRFDRGHIL